MASIRRTQSPHHYDRAHLNGGLGGAAPSPLSLSSSASSKSLSGAGAGGGGPSLLAALGRLLLGFFLPRPSRKASAAAVGSGGGGGGGWRPSLYRFFFCFLLGLLLGCAPFFGPSEIKTGAEFALDAGSSLSSAETAAAKSAKATAKLATATAKSATATASSLPEFSREERAAESAERAEPAEIVRVELRSRADPGAGSDDRKLLIVVTPTYNRALQAFYLNRLGQTLRLVPPPLVWVVVESEAATAETAEALRRSGVMYRHVVSDNNSTDVKDRGVHQRNAALELIELHKLDGILYFADDDNVYSLELFDRLREIKRFGVWPVAMLAQGKAKAVLEGPVCNGTQVIGWHTNEKSKRLRRFHVDMSGFAFNSTILWDTKRWKRPTTAPIRQLDSVKEGFQETTFIEQMVEDENQMEGIPSGCSKIMNWHLHIESSGLVYPSGWLLEKNLNAVIPIKL